MNILKGTLFFIGLFVLSRLVPHPPNFTPLIAAVIFLPFISKDKLGMVLPISVMLISDLIIGFHGQMFWVYGGFTLISLLKLYSLPSSLFSSFNISRTEPNSFFPCNKLWSLARIPCVRSNCSWSLQFFCNGFTILC